MPSWKLYPQAGQRGSTADPSCHVARGENFERRAGGSTIPEGLVETYPPRVFPARNGKSSEPAKKEYLVGGLVAMFYFPRNIGILIIPIDFHTFQRGSNHQPGIFFVGQRFFSVFVLLFPAVFWDVFFFFFASQAKAWC